MRQALCKAKSVWAAWGMTINTLSTALPKGGQGQARLAFASAGAAKGLCMRGVFLIWA
ncbi:MAG: hypothetical protein PHN64_06020 [Desulfovibrionaceae bacterium]|nr:hypothetical protein [Desulfovibrionaceae bacterium]